MLKVLLPLGLASIGRVSSLMLHDSVRDNPEATLEGLAAALADACGGVAPKLSLEGGTELDPRADLETERAAFGEARTAAIHLSHPRGGTR